eukprot:4314716-Prymnesium_polylepis.2
MKPPKVNTDRRTPGLGCAVARQGGERGCPTAASGRGIECQQHTALPPISTTSSITIGGTAGSTCRQ